MIDRKLLLVLLLSVSLVGVACSSSSDGPTTSGANGGTLPDGAPSAGDDASVSGDAGVDSVGDGATPPASAPGQFNPADVGPGALPPVTKCEAAAGSTCLYAAPVSAGGAGTTCSQAQPCTVKTALPRLKGGDFLYLAAGTYAATGSTGASASADQLNMDKYFAFAAAPSETSRITIKGTPGKVVDMHGNQTDPCAFIDGQSWVTFSGIVFENCGPAGIKVGDDAPGTTRGIHIDHDEFRDLYASDNMGAGFFSGAPGAVFEHNLVHDFHYSGGGSSTGLIAFQAKDLTIQFNEIHHVGVGFYYKHGEATTGAGGFTHVYGNWVHDTTVHGMGINQNRTELKGNLFTNTQDVYLFQADGTNADFVFDVDIEHNTFVKSSLTLNDPTDGFTGAKNTTIKRNIFLDSPYRVWPYGQDAACKTGIGLVSDENCFFAESGASGAPSFNYFGSNGANAATCGGGTYSFDQWKGATGSADTAVLAYDKTSIVADPKLDATFHGAPGSACLAYGAYAP